MCDTKKCTKCGKELPLEGFYKKTYKSGRTGYMSACKDCKKIASAKWSKNNPHKVRTAAAKWQRNNRDKTRTSARKWIKNNPEKSRASKRIAQSKWAKNNPEYRAKYYKERRAIDPSFKLMHNIRAAINLALKYNSKFSHTEELLGCSIKYLYDHLEEQFKPGMNWNNWSRTGWHIDHIIPLSYFDMSDPEQQKRAWHYTNLQPLWAKDNIRKSNKIEECQLTLL